MSQKKITVITVCYNAEKSIGKTIESVKCQSYKNIEYIIIDGNSKDSTLQKIEEHRGDLPIILISEPDHGIYDAMNKGVAISTGDYIHFLNAGDLYYDKDVINRIVEDIENEGADILYGNILYRYLNGNTETREYGRACSRKIYFATGDCINHQAIFAKRELLTRMPFDLTYKICADRDWMMRVSKADSTFYACGRIICVYGLDGASLIQKDIYNDEAKKCIKKQFLILYPLFLLFDFFRNNAILSKILHWVYRKLYIKKE
ncbi:MAG: glycosyltransferase family 2 protein [Lachnospiraceae bacterium]|nr:glycosyltransferase family 2 protein [Lachnospiraceae bacterium]